jgi:hypothetical protein
MTDTDLLAALRDCYEPGPARRNLVDAGLIQSATLTLDTEAPGHNIPGVPPRYLATVTLLAPGPNADAEEPANAQLLAQIENRLLGVPTISTVKITLLPALFPIL